MRYEGADLNQVEDPSGGGREEKPTREESIGIILGLAVDLRRETGETPEETLAWFLHQDPESFSKLLLDINGASRGLPLEKRGFDGGDVQAGTVWASIPPDQEDKASLLEEMLVFSQQEGQECLANGIASQEILRSLSVAVPVIVNKLHLFGDGNGRTSRFVRMILRDHGRIDEERVRALIVRKGFDRYDTTPAFPVDEAVTGALRIENKTGGIEVDDNLPDEDFPYVEDQMRLLKEEFPNVREKIIKAFADSGNFYEASRLMAREEGWDKVSLRELFRGMENDPELQNKFIGYYRLVRKRRVELLMAGLLGKKEIDLVGDQQAKVDKWINLPRRRKGLPEIKPESIRTIKDFQTAYMETFSPQI